MDLFETFSIDFRRERKIIFRFYTIAAASCRTVCYGDLKGVQKKYKYLVILEKCCIFFKHYYEI